MGRKLRHQLCDVIKNAVCIQYCARLYSVRIMKFMHAHLDLCTGLFTCLSHTPTYTYLTVPILTMPTTHTYLRRVVVLSRSWNDASCCSVLVCVMCLALLTAAELHVISQVARQRATVYSSTTSSVVLNTVGRCRATCDRSLIGIYRFVLNCQLTVDFKLSWQQMTAMIGGL